MITSRAVPAPSSGRHRRVAKPQITQPRRLCRPPVLTPEEFDRLLSRIPARYVPLVLTEIETGLRWGELIALRPRHIDFLRRTVTVEETIVEVPKKVSPTGERMIVKPYPKDDEPRTLRLSPQLLQVVSARIEALGLSQHGTAGPIPHLAWIIHCEAEGATYGRSRS